MHEEAFEETPVSSSKVEKFPARPAIEIQSEIISLATRRTLADGIIFVTPDR